MSQRKYPSMMEKSEWEVPKLVVGDIAVVLHGYRAKDDDAVFSDLICGDTRVIEIKKNGTIVLANGFKFHPNGYGHATNNACVISVRHALDRTPSGELSTDASGNRLSIPAQRDGHYLTFSV